MNLSANDILEEFKQANAILKGHFILSSGLHSDTYLQCARVLMNARRADKLCSSLAKKIVARLGDDFADIVLAPAMGGVIIGFEMGRQLNLDSIFCERVNGKFELRRGFILQKDARVLVVEDVITTGKSSLETYELVKELGGIVVAECCLIDRSAENIEETLGVPVISLLKLAVKTFAGNDVPQELQSIAAVKPGSRFLKN